MTCSAEEQAAARGRGRGPVDGPAEAVAIAGKCIVVDTAEGHYTFDSVYPALGSDTHTQLAEKVGARASSEDGCICVDAHQRTSVPGLYAAGDVVIGLDQISHAMGEGGVAATTIRNDLAKEQPLLRVSAGRPENPGRGRSGRRRIGDAGLERDQRPPATVELDLEQVAGAEILDRDDGAERIAVPVDAGRADEVRVIIFAVVERRQRGTVDLDQRSAQRFGGGAVVDPLEARHRALAVAANLTSCARRRRDKAGRDGRDCRRCR